MIKVNLSGAVAKLQRITQKAQDDAERVRKQITTEVLGHAIMASPVKDGHFAGNWRTAQSVMPSGVVDRLDTSKQIAMSEMLTTVAGSTGDGDIYLVNNLPYAEPLELGHSPQAPGGMIGPAIAILPQIINAAIRNGGR